MCCEDIFRRFVKVYSSYISDKTDFLIKTGLKMWNPLVGCHVVDGGLSTYSYRRDSPAKLQHDVLVLKPTGLLTLKSFYSQVSLFFFSSWAEKKFCCTCCEFCQLSPCRYVGSRHLYTHTYTRVIPPQAASCELFQILSCFCIQQSPK